MRGRRKGNAAHDAIRTFVALPVPEALIGFLDRTIRRLRQSVANVGWVPAANVHLTLKFLGDIDPVRVPEISARLDAASRLALPFSLTATGVGVFPNLRRARVLWIGLSGELARLESLRQDIDNGLAQLGFDPENRPFRAHLTIGRIRKRTDPGMLAGVLQAMQEESSEAFDIDQVRLYQSVLRSTGAVYHLLHAAHLADDGHKGQ